MASGTKASLCGGPCLAVVTAAMIVAPLLAPKANRPLDVKAVSAETGYAYIAPVVLPRSLIFAFPSDASGDSAASALVLLEDGRALGPAHTSHDEIGRRAAGVSRIGVKVCSSPPATIPTRVRTAEAIRSARSPTLASWIAILIFALDAAFVLAMRKSLLALVRRHRNATARALAAISVAAALLIPWRIRWTVLPGCGLASVDLGRGYAGLAVVLTLAQWAIGAGIARALLPKRGTSYTQVVLLGFPVGLVASAILAAVALLAPLGGGRSQLVWGSRSFCRSCVGRSRRHRCAISCGACRFSSCSAPRSARGWRCSGTARPRHYAGRRRAT